MTPLRWPCPSDDGGKAGEYALACDRRRALRLLIVPALFDEANRMRRFTVEVMRRLDAAGIDTMLPDLPGTNESLRALDVQTPEGWSRAMAAAAETFAASHALGVRGGCLFTPAELPRLHYAPARPSGLLRQMIRARILASREAGREETTETIRAQALAEGIELSGHRLGAAFFRDFETIEEPADDAARVIEQSDIGGPGLWLRAEPGESDAQADALARIVAEAIMR
ncbi:hypothetical protein B2G71_21410 [Novosphingobium sp. PC22D]|uniref:hypothetical protein n=1 Tax=Novosphingobium sp. PC22D TaxID=1962403 RepID=UPI000BEFC819|nr:hypothetical protein [Novosphingobium sp. PC22D]PEQ10638.1 hypothetical protein B2G71_21410 [Novosphingobium sp. PC22D]